MADSSSIFLHAELLPNIRQLTVHVSLPIPSSSIDLRASTITLSESRRAITVYTIRGTGDEKEDVLETLKLPVRVTEASRRNLTFAGHQVDSPEGTNSTEYSFRLQVDDHDAALITVNNGLHEDDFVPWTAKDMSPRSVLHCRSCSQEILGRQQQEEASSWAWKDLPSGNWAEMMDFWHCHKPDVHVDEKDQHRVTDDQNASVKGYGASNRVVALPGTVLVDVASFLVAEGDCYNIKRSEVPDSTYPGSSSNTTRANIDCKRCGTIVGMEDPTADGLRLYKSNVSVRNSQLLDAATFESYPTEMITSAQLLELINREGVRRFVIHAGHQDGILVWAFNPDLRYSSASADHSIVTRRAMKVLYQELANVEKILEPEKGTAVPLSLEELFLPATIYAELTESLKKSTGVLPTSARIFREWNVAFLSRYGPGQMMANGRS